MQGLLAHLNVLPVEGGKVTVDGTEARAALGCGCLQQFPWCLTKPHPGSMLCCHDMELKVLVDPKEPVAEVQPEDLDCRDVVTLLRHTPRICPNALGGHSFTWS